MPISQTKGPKSDIVVTTLGTGTPVYNPLRCSQSILIEAGNFFLLFDTGRGTAQRLVQAGIVPAQIDMLFFTHYHSDHTVGFADFWLGSWLPAGGGRSKPLKVAGPTGVQALIDGHRIAFADDIRMRVVDQKLPLEGTHIEVASHSDCGVLLNQSGLKVTSFETFHGKFIKPNWGYRIDYAGRSIVIGGDSNNARSVAKIATDADLFFHSVGAADASLLKFPEIADILQHHTTPQQAGEIFSIARPKIAALIHIVTPSRPGFPTVQLEDIKARTEEFYKGSIIIAEDLMRFEISDDINIIAPKKTSYGLQIVSTTQAGP